MDSPCLTVSMWRASEFELCSLSLPLEQVEEKGEGKNVESNSSYVEASQWTRIGHSPASQACRGAPFQYRRMGQQDRKHGWCRDRRSTGRQRNHTIRMVRSHPARDGRGKERLLFPLFSMRQNCERDGLRTNSNIHSRIRARDIAEGGRLGV